MNFFVSVIIIIIVIVRITKELLPGNIIHTILVTPVVKSPYFYRLYLMSIVFSDVRDLSGLHANIDQWSSAGSYLYLYRLILHQACHCGLVS